MNNVIKIDNIQEYDQQIVGSTLILTKKLQVFIEDTLLVEDKDRNYEEAYNNIILIEKINLGNMPRGRPIHSFEKLSNLITLKLEEINKYIPKLNVSNKKQFVDFIFDKGDIKIEQRIILEKNPREYYYTTINGQIKPELMRIQNTDIVEAYKRFQITLITGLCSLIYPKYYTSDSKCSSCPNYGQPIATCGFLEKYQQPRMNYEGNQFCPLGICYCQKDIQDKIILAENTLHLLKPK